MPTRPSLQEVEEQMKLISDKSGLNLADERTGQASIHGLGVPAIHRKIDLYSPNDNEVHGPYSSADAGFTIPLENGRRIHAWAGNYRGPLMNLAEHVLYKAGSQGEEDPAPGQVYWRGTIMDAAYDDESADQRSVMVRNRDQARDFINTIGKKHMSPQFQELSKIYKEQPPAVTLERGRTSMLERGRTSLSHPEGLGQQVAIFMQEP